MLASATAARSAKASTTASACAAASASLAEELGASTRITAATATSITGVIPDRTGDAIDDTVTYSWSGKSGDPMLRTVNGGDPQTVLVGVQSLAFSYVTQTRRLAAAASQSAETLLATNAAPASTNTVQVQSSWWVGLAFRPALPADAASWGVSRVRLMLKSKSVGGQTDVQIRRIASSTPGGSALESVRVADTDLATSFGWKDCTFKNISGLSPSDSLAIVLKWVAGANSCEVQYQPSGTYPAGDVMFRSSDSGASWSAQSGQSLVYEVYGTVVRPGVSQQGSVYRSLRIRAVVASPDLREIATTIAFVNEPAVN